MRTAYCGGRIRCFRMVSCYSFSSLDVWSGLRFIGGDKVVNLGSPRRRARVACSIMDFTRNADSIPFFVGPSSLQPPSSTASKRGEAAVEDRQGLLIHLRTSSGAY